MPNVIREDVDQLNVNFTVSITKSDFEPKFKKALKDYSKKATLKGFRKGQTPISFVKKLYGKPIFADVISNLLQTEIESFLKDMKTVGFPIPLENQQIDLDPKKLEDQYDFQYTVGLAPDMSAITLDGLENIGVEKPVLTEISEEFYAEQFDMLRSQNGENVDVENDIVASDVVTFQLKELDGDAIKADGWECEFQESVDRITGEEIKKELLTKKKGDIIRFAFSEFNDKLTPEILDKYYLKKEEGDADVVVGDSFEATIVGVSRFEKGELTEDLFKKNFGEEVTTEEQARKIIEERVRNDYDRIINNLVGNEVMLHLAENSNIEFPMEFIKKSAELNNEETFDAEEFDRMAPEQSKQLFMSYFASEYAKKKEISITHEDVIAAFKQKYGQYAAQMGDEIFNQIAANFLKENKEEARKIAEDAQFKKIIDAIGADAQVATKEMAFDELKEHINERYDALNAKLKPESEEE